MISHRAANARGAATLLRKRTKRVARERLLLARKFSGKDYCLPGTFLGKIVACRKFSGKDNCLPGNCREKLMLARKCKHFTLHSLCAASSIVTIYKFLTLAQTQKAGNYNICYLWISYTCTFLDTKMLVETLHWLQFGYFKALNYIQEIRRKYI